MRHLRFARVIVVGLVGMGALARADVAAGDDKLLHGDYAEAIATYRAVKGKDAGRAQLRLGRALLVTGDLAGARAAAEAAGKAADKDRALAADAAVLSAEIHRVAGEHGKARALLEATVKKEPRHLRARAQLGLVYEATGEKALAARIWNGFYDDHDAGKIPEKAEPQLYLAIAARHLGDFRGANDTLQQAVELDGNLLEANVEWGWLFLTKYNAGDAEQSFDEVLKIDSRNPDAHAGMARVKLEQGYDVRGADEHLGKALAVNPAHARALCIRAEIQIDNAEYAAAEKTLAALLAVDPNHVDARTLLAAIAWLKDDLPRYQAERQRVFAVNPRHSRFYHVIAEFAVKEHRYKEAIGLEEEALKLDPKDTVAMAGIGSGYLRLGEEAKGLKILQEAGKGDPFNVRTYNMLNLFEDVIPDKYETIAPAQPRGVFRFRVPKDERETIERYLPRTLGRAYADMVKRYGFSPRLPIVFELYNDPDHYSVRTVGLPNLGALGVCFGQVVTALSPSNGNVNWGMILWHELGHVFAIQASSSRVPRWYTEGLSEYETIIARPEWRRENDVDVWMAVNAGKLPSVVELNTRFLRAKDMNDMVVAYHMSSVVIEFIVKRWGFPKVVEGLRLFGKGQDTAQVIAAITGLAPPAFDAEFRKYLDGRLAPYRGQFKVQLADYDDLTSLEKAAAARPGDAEAHADLALGQLAGDEADRAAASAEAALAIDGKNKKALWVLAEVASAKGNLGAQRERLLALIAAGGDGYDARMGLARAAKEAGDLKETVAQLEKAKQLDPERSEPYLVLAEIFAKTNREDEALREMERYVMIEQMEYAPLKKLVDKYAARKVWPKVRQLGEMALYINPFDADLHVTLGMAYVETGAPEQAIHELDSALKSDPPLRRPAVAQIGLARAYLAKRDSALARRAVDAALKLEPENAEARELAKKLGK
jgi:tetratricopeptide (TPR) repeat protein